MEKLKSVDAITPDLLPEGASEQEKTLFNIVSVLKRDKKKLTPKSKQRLLELYQSSIDYYLPYASEHIRNRFNIGNVSATAQQETADGYIARKLKEMESK